MAYQPQTNDGAAQRRKLSQAHQYLRTYEQPQDRP